MKSIKFLDVALLTFVTFLISGCGQVKSVNPLYPACEKIQDENLLGNWGNDDYEKIVVSQPEEVNKEAYVIKFFKGEKETGRFYAILLKSEDLKFLEILPDITLVGFGDKDKVDSYYSANFLQTFDVFIVKELKQDKVVLKHLSAEDSKEDSDSGFGAVKAFIKNSGVEYVQPKQTEDQNNEDGSFLLVDTSEGLLEFYKSAAKNEKLWQEFEFTRLPVADEFANEETSTSAN